MKTPASATASVRVSPPAYRLLRQLALDEGISMQAVLDQALEQYRRERFLRAANDDFAELKRNLRAWRGYRKEIDVWNQATQDGLGEK